MKKHCEFPDLRVDLDNAITYGTLKVAAAIAKDGLRQAQNKGFPAEAEYFLAQQDIIKKRYSEDELMFLLIVQEFYKQKL